MTCKSCSCGNVIHVRVSEFYDESWSCPRCGLKFPASGCEHYWQERARELERSQSRICEQKELAEANLELERLKVRLLDVALNLSANYISELTDICELENFGPETEKSCVLSVAACKLGLASEGDSAFSLNDLDYSSIAKVKLHEKKI